MSVIYTYIIFIHLTQLSLPLYSNTFFFLAPQTAPHQPCYQNVPTPAGHLGKGWFKDRSSRRMLGANHTEKHWSRKIHHQQKLHIGVCRRLMPDASPHVLLGMLRYAALVCCDTQLGVSGTAHRWAWQCHRWHI